MADQDQATQDPTVSRIRRAEQQGQFARSRELATAIMWLGGLALLATFGGALLNSLGQLASGSWSQSQPSITADEMVKGQMAAAQQIFWTGLLPILGGVAVIAVLAHSAQSNFRFLPHLVVPDLQRLNPASNLAKLFRLDHLVNVLSGLTKFLVLVVVAIWVVIGDLPSIMMLGQGTIQHSSQSLGEWLINSALRLSIAAVAVGVIDYGIHWQLHRRSLRMSDQELRDEQRSMEPSQEVSARRRLRQR